MLGCASRLLLGEIIYPPSPSKLTLTSDWERLIMGEKGSKGRLLPVSPES